jgi:hypothetical protein
MIMANLKSPVTFTLKVTVTGMADEVSNRGNYGMRGVTVETLDVKGCDADMVGAFAPNGGNGSQIALYFAPDGVKRQSPKAPVALPKKGATKAKAKAPAKTEAQPALDDIVAAVMAAMAK